MFAVRHDAPRMATQAQRTALARRRLLDATAALIAEHGVANTSVAAIGERAEMSRGAANFHFGSKDALIVALAKEVSEEIELQAERASARVSDPATLEGVVDAILGVQTDLLRTHPERARLIEMLTYEASGPSPLLRNHFAAHYARLRERLGARLEELRELGAVRPDLDTAASAGVVIAICRGLAAQYLLAPDEPEIESTMREARRTLIAALSA